MSISDAYITIDCDECNDTEEMTLEIVYFDYSGEKPYYDLRKTLERARREGWTIDEGSDAATCADCSRE